MAILEDKISIMLHSKNLKHYERMGYEIPKYINNQKRKKFKKGTLIEVDVNDLPRGSNLKVTKICDSCGNSKTVKFRNILLSRIADKDYCTTCYSKLKLAENRPKKNEKSNCNLLSDHFPEIFSLISEDNLNFDITCGSNRLLEFTCSECKKKQSKVVKDIVKCGFKCKFCSDGISYPEKFMINVLNQLNVDYEREKVFCWSKSTEASRKRRYDFYISLGEIIIEVNGAQHYNNGFYSLGGRTLEEEKENDIQKKMLAMKHGIKNYIVIDCRKSNNNYIKEKIITSEMSKLFELSNIDWEKCNTFALSSQILKAGHLWGKKQCTQYIANELKVSRATAIDYIKKCSQLGICHYNPYLSNKHISIKHKRPVVQLSINDEQIKVWASIKEVSEKYKVHRSAISAACRGKTKVSCGYKWMYKEDYDKMISQNLTNQ